MTDGKRKQEIKGKEEKNDEEEEEDVDQSRLYDPVTPEEEVKYQRTCFYQEWNGLFRLVNREVCEDIYKGTRVAQMILKEPYISAEESTRMAYGYMSLLMKSIDGTGFEDGRFTIGARIGEEIEGEVGTYCTLGRSMSFSNNAGEDPVLSKALFHKISKQIEIELDNYSYSFFSRLIIRAYCSKEVPIRERSIPSTAKCAESLWNLLSSSDPVIDADCRQLPVGRARKPSFISQINKTSKECKSMLVGDIETVLVNGTHMAYAAGLLLVRPGEKNMVESQIETYFSEDYCV